MIRSKTLVQKGTLRCQKHLLASSSLECPSRTQSLAAPATKPVMAGMYQKRNFHKDNNLSRNLTSNYWLATAAANQNSFLSAHKNIQRHFSGGCSQHFDNESEYHGVADETLEDIQDAVEAAIEDHDIGGSNEEQPEVVYASGVLTMAFPPHGTWVLNKQTPNRQIWWSSPISGPRRYEYDPETSEWVYTRENETLSQAIAGEFLQIYDIDLEME